MSGYISEGESNAGPFPCPDNYYKCPGNYCIPVHYICDGHWHCPNGEDEVDCGT